MSFILDALKKSEAERQRQDAPGIASIPTGGRKKGGPKWIWIVTALLAVNLVVLSVLLLGRDVISDLAVESPVAINEPKAAAEPVTEVIREEQPDLPQPAAKSTVANDRPSAVSEPATGIVPAAPARQGITEGLPTFNDLRARGELQLPDMHLDIHVYSGVPADRFVFVNMSKYTENSTLSEGPSVREITGDGVVLEYQGTRFLLPRE